MKTEALTAWLQQRMPAATQLAIRDLRAANSGLNNETWLFKLTYVQGGETHADRLVLRRHPSQGGGLYPLQDFTTQYEVMQALADTPVPVPVTRGYEADAAVIGSPFYLMEEISGETASDFPPGIHGHGLLFDATPAQRARMWNAGLEAMAELHRLDPRQLALPPLIGDAADFQESIRQNLERIEIIAGWSNANDLEIVREALARLRAATPAPSRLSLLWGDAKPGNFLFHGQEIAAVLDWEFATVGLPALDIVYYLATLRISAELANLPILEGLPSDEGSLATYERAVGEPLANYPYAELFVLTRLAISLSFSVKKMVKDGDPEAVMQRLSVYRRLRALLDQPA